MATKIIFVVEDYVKKKKTNSLTNIFILQSPDTPLHYGYKEKSVQQCDFKIV